MMPAFRRSSSIRDTRGHSKSDNAELGDTCWSRILSNNLAIRIVLGLIIAGGTVFVICLGPIYGSILILLLINMAYYEMVSLYDKVIQQHKQATGEEVSSKTGSVTGKFKKRVRIYVITEAFDVFSFISLETYFLLTTMVGISFPWLLPRLARKHPNIAPICGFVLSYHHLLLFISFFCGVVKFILSLEKGRSRQQFLRFAFIIMALLYVVIQSMMIIANLYYGMVWFLLPHAMIALNDVMAYFFGKMFGRTPLISLSPNKTLEGFLGAFVSTSLVVGMVTPTIMNFQPMVCPVNNFDFTPFAWMTTTCEPESIYKTSAYILPTWAANVLGMKEVLYKPCFVHVMILTLFASLFAPFGGFLASGFKRALKVKDFSDTIPGHGGMMDRFDCHILMGTFTYLYLKTFVRRSNYSPDAVMKVIAKMAPKDRTMLLEKLQEAFG
ncbi:cytidine diphosphate-diacylglycerol synthase, putative [Babesia bigemina]|uniref:Phosphatidate cytidylyltransferase n=1 Tax=Babesia bigemina TaxID=5866 RepID=A0A061D0N5_BABBI|nr:cytidine diphosphate-diacylglycerol synthase, putative [Babesia bigemina]CDR94213.1 cytidine diphosphate-diacylglycerol synthase, putative [Babesia bigemina]|eukprot:XP_012766399.1 cytidine diphosphate-diacylglycerol synthase, putative [Babesia bigemina]